MEKADELAIAAEAWVEMFGSRRPVSEEELQVELFSQSSEKANVVTLAVHRHGYVDFLAALERYLAAPKRSKR